MNQSENINELASALCKAQSEMQAAVKDSVNPYFKSKYADLGSVWDAARPVLSKNGLCVIQTTNVLDDKTMLVTTLAHSSGQWVKSFLPLNPTKNDSQGMGAAITYLRRYSLSAIVGVVCDEDDDGETAVGRGKTQEIVAKPKMLFVTQSQADLINEMKDKLDEEGISGFLKWLKTSYGSANVSEIPAVAFDRVMTVLHAKIKMLNQMVTA